MPQSEIQLRTSPHLHAPRSVAMIMRHVVYALLPLAGFAVWTFGVSALATVVMGVLACVGTEEMFARWQGKPSSWRDGSAIITGVLLGLTLPPGFPLWMTALGGFIAIAMGKVAFGGLGCNLFNPALVGRAFLQGAFPVAITTYTPPLLRDRFLEFIPSSLAWPFGQPPAIAEWLARVTVDGFSGATPLMAQKFDRIVTDTATLFWGRESGSAGETPALLILICGAYLAVRGMLNWRIPAAMLGTAALVAAIFHAVNPGRFPDAAFTLGAGGLMLGAVFMATDMVGAPVTPRGVWIYGAIMGLMTVLIRNLGGLPEGVMYAILLGNAVSPLIDNVTQPKVYGAVRRKAKAAA
jgi:electron transport complex protein RnfD